MSLIRNKDRLLSPLCMCILDACMYELMTTMHMLLVNLSQLYNALSPTVCVCVCVCACIAVTVNHVNILAALRPHVARYQTLHCFRCSVGAVC